MWYIELDNELKCFHVNLVESTNVPGEVIQTGKKNITVSFQVEFLFVPYSTFTVQFLIGLWLFRKILVINFVVYDKIITN